MRADYCVLLLRSTERLPRFTGSQLKARIPYQSPSFSPRCWNTNAARTDAGIGLSGPRTERQTTSLSSRSSTASSRAKFILELATAYSPARSSMFRTVSGVSRNPKAANWFSTGRTAWRCPARLARSSIPAVPSKGRLIGLVSQASSPVAIPLASGRTCRPHNRRAWQERGA